MVVRSNQNQGSEADEVAARDGLDDRAAREIMACLS